MLKNLFPLTVVSKIIPALEKTIEDIFLLILEVYRDMPELNILRPENLDKKIIFFYNNLKSMVFFLSNNHKCSNNAFDGRIQQKLFGFLTTYSYCTAKNLYHVAEITGLKNGIIYCLVEPLEKKNIRNSMWI